MDVALRCIIRPANNEPIDVLSEIVSVELFGRGATAVGHEINEAGELVLLAGFLSEDDAHNAFREIDAQFPDAIHAATVEQASTDWTVAQRSGLRPIQVGPWHIRAPWDPQPDDVESRFDIVIDPGSAFGHGAHPSTRMAIELLLRSAKPGGHLVDVGTGTGVIAIIAARLGMRVDAIESDHGAAEVAWHNIDRNSTYPFDDVGDSITLQEGDAREIVPDSSVSVAVANVTLDVHREIAAPLRAVPRIILSGVLCRQVQAARELYPHHESRTIRTHGEWASLDLLSRKT